MSGLTDDTAVKVSTDAAEAHVNRFYRALDSQAQRNNIASFFMPHEEMGDGIRLPFINFNGKLYPDGAAFQGYFERMPQTKFEVQSFDAQVINPLLTIEGRTEADANKGMNMSILILVSGSVSMVSSQENTERKGFSDTFVLTPNPQAATPKRRDRGQKDWLIQSYNSRLVT